MTRLDRIMERMSRSTARGISRRSFFGRATAFGFAAAMPLLPVSRANAAQQPGETGDPQSCDYWRYCAIDGFLCTCCGGSVSACPPGTEMSPITWIGTCTNPADKRAYIISYNDCCGLSSCGHCLCNRNEGDRPPVRPQSNNDYNWCLGTESSVYNCSTAVIVGVATERR
jgi:methylamine dehydrogenase light chain